MTWDIFREVGEILTEMGGKGSGNWGHKGRKGKKGGSAPGKGGAHNAVGEYHWDEKSQLGGITVNGESFGIFRPEIGWDERNFRPKRGYGIEAANDWNPSGRIRIESNTLGNLVKKIEKHEHRLVKPSMGYA